MVHHELQSALITGITGHLLQHELFDQLIKPKLLYASFTELYKHLSVLLNSSEGIYHGPMELRASQILKMTLDALCRPLVSFFSCYFTTFTIPLNHKLLSVQPGLDFHRRMVYYFYFFGRAI